MTTITQAFLQAVKENHRKEITLARKMLLFAILIMALFILLVWFFVDNFSLAISLGSAIYLLLILCVALFVFSNRQKCNQSFEIASEAARKIQSSMQSIGLPLDQYGFLIREELQEALTEKQQTRKSFAEYARKTFNTIVFVPCAFLLALLFQAMFDKSVILQLQNIYAPISFIVEIFTLLVTIMLLSIALYFPIVNLAQFINGENELQDCLDLLKEVDVCYTYEKNQQGKE